MSEHLKSLLRQERSENPDVWASIVLARELLLDREINAEKIQKVYPSPQYSQEEKSVVAHRGRKIAELCKQKYPDYKTNVNKYVQLAESDYHWNNEVYSEMVKQYNSNGMVKQKLHQWVKEERQKDIERDEKADKNNPQNIKNGRESYSWVLGACIMIPALIYGAIKSKEETLLGLGVILLFALGLVVLFFLSSIARNILPILPDVFIALKDYFKKYLFKKPTSILFLIATIINLVGLNDMPYGFYMILRLITCGVCVYSAVKFKLEWTKWIFGGLAVLYNPILPVHLDDKEVWVFVNLVTIVYMWLALYFESRLQRKK